MSRLLSMLAAAALVAAAQPAAAAPAVADDDAAWLGVLQQGKGQGGGHGGGGQEAHGGGHGQGGGQEARESRGRSSGGSEARQSGQGQSARGSSQAGQGSGGSARGSGNSGRGSGSAAEERGKGNSSGGAARTERGNSGGNAGSARNERGNSGGNSSSARSERGNSGGNANARSEARGANASATGTERRNANATANASGRRSGPRDLQARIAALPEAQRRMATSSRISERMAAGAIARAHARGLAANAFDVRSDNDRVRILNRRGDLLFDMDDRRAGELGGWDMRRLGDQSPRANAPAFCRSGQGHPVWGREWCIDKGFGLGSRQGTLWSRGGIGDVIFRQPDYRTRLDRGGLIGVLGDIVLGRLALQSVALGYDQPLTGSWVADPSGPYILRVRSGDNDVAEF
ncbi:MAG TPA: hypothetical protein VGX50_17175, partial [Longimicrobium sp.]|nr:hypothetical protein [Longimicrobium sp.]